MNLLEVLDLGVIGGCLVAVKCRQGKEIRVVNLGIFFPCMGFKRTQDPS